MNKLEEELIKKLQADTLVHNVVAQIANKEERGYITPEDIREALKLYSEEKVRLDVLEVLSNTSGFSAEDDGLCAFVAFNGKNK